jgi:hypothetical protein
MEEITDEVEWLCSFMSELDIIETPIIPKSIKYPEIDTSYAFRPYTRHPKLIRAVVEEQQPRKPTTKELNDVETQYKISVYLEELEVMYKFHANSKRVNPPKRDIKQIENELNSKLISQYIRKTWSGISTNQMKEESLSTTKSWNHEDALAEAKELIATWNFVFKRPKPSV